MCLPAVFISSFSFLYPALVAEVTQPSLGVGYEIGRAIENRRFCACSGQTVENVS